MNTRARTSFARRAEFFDRIVSDADLSRGALAVAWRLINHINDETAECFPSEKLLSDHLNITVRTVRRGVEQLISSGWFTKILRGRGGTQYFANYKNRTEVSAYSSEQSANDRRPPQENDDNKNRTSVSGKDDPENRTSLAKKPDNLGKKNRTELSAEPKDLTEVEPKTPPLSPPTQTDDLHEAVSAFNKLADRIGLAKVQNFSDTRQRKLRRRLIECGGIDGWRAALAKVEASSFLTGGGRDGWRADFDFILQAKSFTKIMEGAYDNHARRGRASNDIKAALDRNDPTAKGVEA